MTPTPAPSRLAASIAGEDSRPTTGAAHVEGGTAEDPLIKVVLRPHEGHEAKKPFTVQPAQMVS